MHGRSRRTLLASFCLILSSASVWAQSPAAPSRPGPPQHLPRFASGGGTVPSPISFARLAQTAGTIFAGTVTRIEPGAASGGQAVAIVAITFRVDRPLRGTPGAASFTIHEWLGLWSSGQRYAVGEHLLLFLYPPSKLGLTSSVAGMMGRFRLDPADAILPSPAQLAAFQSDPFLAGRSRIPFEIFTHSLGLATAAQEPE